MCLHVRANKPHNMMSLLHSHGANVGRDQIMNRTTESEDAYKVHRG